MVVASFASSLLGWKPSTKNKLGWSQVPNTADVDNAESLRLSAGMLEALGIGLDSSTVPPKAPGAPLEHLTAEDLSRSLPDQAPDRHWDVTRGRLISDFIQYEHLKDLDALVLQQPELRITIGRDYVIRPDVTVAILDGPASSPTGFLHGVVSCKWTIRSDRVQNIRHEYGQLIRHRRGRLPHLVTLTAEPLPSRLASIARGTGEVDATYHLAFDALRESVLENSNSEQRDFWDEAVEQRRLRPYTELAETLARW